MTLTVSFLKRHARLVPAARGVRVCVCVRECMCTCMFAYVCTRMWARTCACMCACVHVHVRVRACVHACVLGSCQPRPPLWGWLFGP